MSNITFSIQEDLLKAGREYARRHRISLNTLIRELLRKTVTRTTSSNWLDECFKRMDSAHLRLKDTKWKREDIYDV